jgi:hypothetical protein
MEEQYDSIDVVDMLIKGCSHPSSLFIKSDESLPLDHRASFSLNQQPMVDT